MRNIDDNAHLRLSWQGDLYTDYNVIMCRADLFIILLSFCPPVHSVELDYIFLVTYLSIKMFPFCFTDLKDKNIIKKLLT